MIALIELIVALVFLLTALVYWYKDNTLASLLTLLPAVLASIAAIREYRKIPALTADTIGTTQHGIPRSDGSRFSIAVADLNGDSGAVKAIIEDCLAQIDGIQILSIDRSITISGDDIRSALSDGHRKAKDVLMESNADVLLWGNILHANGTEIPRLHWTPSTRFSSSTTSGKYRLNEDLDLPDIFWDDMAIILTLLSASALSQFVGQRGIFVASKIQPYIEKTRTLLISIDKTPTPKGWTRTSVDLIKNIFAESLQILGEQNGSIAVLSEAVTMFEDLIKDASEMSPVSPEIVLNNLGCTLRTVGEYSKDITYYEKSEDILNKSLELTKATQSNTLLPAVLNNLATAQLRHMERSPDTALLIKAIENFRAAIQESETQNLIRPFDQATTYQNLGNALAKLAELTNDVTPLDEALMLHEKALSLRPRENVPLMWAQSKLANGTTLMIQAKLTGDPILFKRAITCFRDALTENTRGRMPHVWAHTQINLAQAIYLCGSIEHRPDQMKQAISVFDEVLEVVSWDLYPDMWISARTGTAYVIARMAEEESDPDRKIQEFGRAVHILSEMTQDPVRVQFPQDWAIISNNYSIMLAKLGLLCHEPRYLIQSAHKALDSWEILVSVSEPMSRDALGNAVKAIDLLKHEYGIDESHPDFGSLTPRLFELEVWFKDHPTYAERKRSGVH